MEPRAVRLKVEILSIIKNYWSISSIDLCHLPIYVIYWFVSPTDLCQFTEVSLTL